MAENIENGELNFTVGMDSSGLMKEAQQVLSAMGKMTESVEAFGNVGEDWLNTTKEDLKIQKQVIKELEKQYEELGEKIKSVNSGSAKDKLLQEYKELGQEIESEKDYLKDQEDALKANELAHSNLTIQLRRVREEMGKLKSAGLDNTEEYAQLSDKAKELSSDIKELGEELSPKNLGLSSVASGITTVTGAMSAASGAVGLFGERNENLNEIMQKMQSLMAITIGLQQVSTNLRKGSVLMIGIEKIQTAALAKAKELETAAKIKGTAATKAATVAQKAFNIVAKSNPYVLLATAILTVVGALVAFTLGAKDSADAQRDLNAEMERYLQYQKDLRDLSSSFSDTNIKLMEDELKVMKAQGASIDKIREKEQAIEDQRRSNLEARKQRNKTYNKSDDEINSDLQRLEVEVEGYRRLVETAKNREKAGLEMLLQQKERALQTLKDEIKDRQFILEEESSIEAEHVERMERYRKEDEQNEKEAQEEKKRRAEESKKSREKQANEEAALQAELKRVREQVEDVSLSGQEDNLDTRIKKIETAYNREITDAELNAEKAKNEGKLELAKEYENLASALRDKREKEIEAEIEAEGKMQDEANQKQLEKYETFAEKEKKIRKKYADEINELQKKRDTYEVGSEEWDKYNKAMEVAKEKEKSEVLDLQVEYSKLNQLIAERETLEKQLQLAIENGDEALVEQLQNKIKSLEKEIENLSGSSKKKGIETVDWIGAAVDGLNQIADALAEIEDVKGLDNVATGIRSIAKGVSGFVNGAKQGGLAGGFLGLLTAGIEDTINQITTIITKTAALKESIASTQREARTQAWLDEADAAMNGQGVFGEDRVSQLNNAISVMEDAKNRLADMSKEMQDLGKFAAEDYLAMTNLLNWKNFVPNKQELQADFKAYQDAIAKGYNELEARIFKTQSNGWLATFFGFDDKYENLRDMVEGLGYDLYDEYGNLNSDALQALLDTYDDLSQADRDWITEAIAYSDEYKEAMENIASYLSDLFGGVAESIADRMVEAFIATGDAAVDLGEVVADVGKNMAKDLVKSLIISTYFEGMEDDFKNMIAKNGMTADTAGYIIGRMNKAMVQLGNDTAYWNNVMANLSGLWEDYEGVGESVGTALSSASQESIDMMSGQLNAMRTVQSRIDGKIDSILLELQGFHRDANSRLDANNEKLDQIISNTSEQGSLVRGIGAYL